MCGPGLRGVPRGRTLSAEGKQLILQDESEKYMRGDNIKRTKEILSQAKDIPSVGINGGMLQSCLVCEPAPTLAVR